jgi:TonB family protein
MNFQLALLLMLSGVFSAFAQSAFAQGAAQAETPQTGVVITKLSPPVYPPLSRQARVTGDVKIALRIRQDGSVESAEVISGHPMLKQAALDSAQKSEFECRGCGDLGVPYSLIFTFGLRDDGSCRDVVEERPARAPKCLYLWRCGVQSFSTWHGSEDRPPEVTESAGHVTIFVSPWCAQTIAAH